MKNERKAKTPRIAAHPEKKNGQEPASARALRKSEPAQDVLERSSLPEQNPNPVMRFQQDGQPLYGNPAASLLLGFSMDQSVPEEWRGLLQTVLTSGSSHEIEVERHGRIFSALFVPVQEAGYINVYCMDRTDYKKTEAALRRSEERFRQAADASSALVYEVDLIADTTVIVHGMERLTGYSPHEIMPSSNWWHSLIHPDDLSEHLAQLDALLLYSDTDVSEYRLRHKEERWIHVQDHRLIIRDEAGRAIRLIGAVTDITERKQLEESLQLHEAELQDVINQTPFMMTRCTRDLRYRFVSRAYADMIGRRREDVAGKPIVEIMGEEGLKTILPYIERVLAGERVEYETEVPFAGIGKPALRVIYTPDRDDQGEVVGWFASIMDITAQKEADQERVNLLKREQAERERAQRAWGVAEEAKIRAEQELWERQQAEAALGAWSDKPLPQETRPAWMRYGLPLAVTALAILVRYLLDPVLGNFAQSSLVIAGIAFSVWYGGVGPALLAALLGFLGIAWFIVQPPNTVLLNAENITSVMVFLFTALTVITLGESMRRAQRHAHQSAGVAVKRQQEVEFRLREQQRTEESLRASEQRFREIFETAGVSVWVEDFSQVKAAIDELRLQGVQDFRAYFADNPDFVQTAIGLVRILDVNQETLNLYGATSKDELLGSLHKIFVPETETVFVEELVTLAEGREVYRSETKAKTLDGRRISFLFTIHFGSPDSDYSRVIVTITDITERKQAEEQLKAARARAEETAFRIGQLQKVTASLSAPLTPSEVSDVLLKEGISALGAAVGSVMILSADGHSLEIVQSTASSKLVQPFLHIPLTTKVPSTDAVRSGQVIWIHSRAAYLRDYPHLSASIEQWPHQSGMAIPMEYKGRIVGVLTASFDHELPYSADDEQFALTIARQGAQAFERARAEEALRTSEALYRNIARSIPGGGVYVVDKDFRYLVAEGPVTESFGLTPQMLEGNTVTEAFPDERGQRMEARLRRNFAGEMLDYETRYNGRTYWTQQAPLEPAREQVIIVTMDITERKKAEESLKQSEERFRQFMEHLPGLAWIKDLQGRYAYANAAAQKAFRTPSDVLYGRSDAEIFSPEVASQFITNDQRALIEGGVQVIETLEHEDGIHHSLVTKFPIPGLDETIEFMGGIAIDVTERMRAEEALRHSEERMRLAIESNRMVAWEWDPATDKVITSANIIDVYGMTGVDGAANAFALIWPEDLPAHQEKVDRVMRYGGEYHSEFRITRPADGRVMWMEEWASGLTDAEGRVTRLVGIVTDLTERKQAEQALKQARAQAEATADRMASLQAITAALVGSVTPMQLAELILEQGTHASGASAGILVEVVHQGRDIKTLAALGYPEAAVRRMPVPLSDSTPMSDCILNGQSVWIGSHEEFAAQYPSLAEFRGALGNEATVALPLSIGDRVIGGLAFSFTEKRDFLLEERGFLLAIAQQCAQALERIRAADSLRESQQRLALTYDHAAIGLVETSPDWQLVQCNDQFTRILGYTKEELLGRSVAEITYAEDARAEGELYRRLMASEIPFYHIEKRFIRKDGSLTWCELVRSAVLDDSGAARFGIGAVFDINDRKRREEALRAQAEEIEALMEVSPIAIFVSHDPACAHVTGNPAAHALLELPLDASNLSKSAPDEQRPTFRVLRDGVELAPEELPMQVAARFGIEVEAAELELQFEDGTRKYEYAFARPLFDAQGRSRGAIATMLDITERKRTEQQMRASEERYRFIVENTSDGIWRIELTEPMPLTLSEEEQVEWYYHHAVMKQCNLELAHMYGYESAEDVIGLPIHEVLPFETNVELTRQFIRAQYRLVDAESRIRHRDGHDLFFLNNMIGIIEDGRLLGQWGTNRDITQRKQAEERLALLAEVSELTRDLEDPLALMAAVSDMMGRHLQVKRCLFNEIDVENDLEIIHHDYHDGVDSVQGIHQVTEYSNTTTAEMMDGQTVINFDSKTDPRTAQDYERSYVPNGERAYIAIPLMRDDEWVASLWVSDNKPRQWSEDEVSLLKTIAERTWTAVEKLRIHAALRDSEERLRVTFNTTAVGFATLTPDTHFVDVNQAFCTVVGYTREELLTMNFDYLTHPNYVKSTRDHMGQLLSGEVPSFVIEKLYIRKDGSAIWVQNSVSLVRDVDGKPLHLIVISQDITERKRIEEELQRLNLELEERVEKRTRELQAASELRRMAMVERRQAQDRFAKSFNASPAAMTITRFEDGMYRNVNPRFTELLEYNLEDVIGHTSLELHIYRNPQERLDLLKTIRSNRGRWDYETQLQTRTGRQLDVTISVVEIELDGEPHILSMIMDVTERNQMLAALRASEQQLRTLFDVLPVGVSYVSKDGQVLESNRTLQKIIDITRDELDMGAHRRRQYIRADGTPMPVTEFASTRALAEQRTIKNVETGIIKEGGQVIWTSVSATPISMPEPGVVVITVDVTERKHMDDELRRSHRRYQILSQRLVEIQEEERRTISRELHDRVGQSLAALNLNLNFMDQTVPASTPNSIKSRIKDAIQLTEETVSTIRDVMADLRPPALDDYGLEAALNAYADTFSRRFGIRVDLVKPADLLPRFNSNIELTLLRIAQEALTNVAKHSHASRATLTLTVQDNAVHLTIQDNGEGIRSWQKANRPGSHGLKIMRERAETFGGTLQVQSFNRKGTRIEVRIPIHDDAASRTHSSLDY